ncbi:MAG: Uncharacterised protein [Methanobacteriota archaeon]|nr:MAG: Uncharacterised protein [Euryarchaeota archaeon]
MKSLTVVPNSIIPDRKKESDNTPSCCPNSGTLSILDFSDVGSENVRFAGSGSKYALPFNPKNSSALMELSSRITLNGAELVLTSSKLLFPVRPLAPGSSGGNRLTRVIFEILKDILASAVVSSTKNLTWSPSIVTGVVAFEIWTSIAPTPSGASIPRVSPSCNVNSVGKSLRRKALY